MERNAVIVITDVLPFAPNAEDAFGHLEVAAHKRRQHSQRHVGAAGIIAVADQVCSGGSVNAVLGICKQVNNVITAPINGITPFEYAE